MQRQIPLWPVQEPTPTAPPLWENLDEPERARLITTLARLISKAGEMPSISPRPEEQEHER